LSVTSIEWTSRTWNPVRGCSRVSEGCRHCYAETFAARNLPEMRSPTTGEPFAVRTPAGPRWTGRVELIPSKLDEPLRWRKPQRIFVNSMSDLFHESLPERAIADVFGTMALASRHTFQILTKRPRRMRDLLAPGPLTALGDHPLPNVWLGVSVEDQATADERIPILLETPAAVHFVSYEPALGPVDFKRLLTAGESDNPIGGSEHSRIDGDVPAARVAAPQQQRPRWDKSTGHEQGDQGADRPAVRTLDWLIVGGESGPGARRFNVAWARSVVRQCKAAGVAVFCKQLGADVIDRNDAGFDGSEPDSWPEEFDWSDRVEHNIDGYRDDYQGAPVRVHLKSRKGGDTKEWPRDLRVRQFPA
jgi:protein gp37